MKNLHYLYFFQILRVNAYKDKYLLIISAFIFLLFKFFLSLLFWEFEKQVNQTLIFVEF